MLKRARSAVRAGCSNVFRTSAWLALIAISAAAWSPAYVSAQVPAAAPEQLEGVRELVRVLMEERDLPSLAVAVAIEGEIVWEEGFGWADRERRIRATSHTPYSLASISKPITATAIMRLVERGKLELDRPANEYLGAGRIQAPLENGEALADGATIRRLLAHTAGLPLHYQFFYDGADYGRPSMDESIARYAVVVNPPGTVYQYSNIGYGVLDHIIERVSGRSFADFLHREVFEPLGMNRTSVDIAPALKQYAAARYDDQQQPVPFYQFDHAGASAVWSSAHDLARFGMFHIGERLAGAQPILGSATIRAMQQVATPEDAGRGYGLGWLIADDRGFHRISHTGGMPGVSTVLNIYPAERTVIVVLTNTGDRVVQAIAQEIARVVLPGYQIEQPEASGTIRPGSGEAPLEGDGRLESMIGRWTGTLVTYEGEVPMELVLDDDGGAHVRIAGGPPARLHHMGLEGDRIFGRFAGTIPTEDARRRPHSVLLDLRLRHGRLAGSATAQTTEQPIHFALSSFVRLDRAADQL